MHTSTILASVFALYFTSLVSQGNLACVNVKQNKSGSTSIRLRGSGGTCGQFPLIVPKSGFHFKVYTPHESTDTFLLSLQIYFGRLLVPLSFVIDRNELSVFTKTVTHLGDATLDVTTIEIKPDGTRFVTPRKDTAASKKNPPLVKSQQRRNDKTTINRKIKWPSVNDEFIIKLPNHANNNPSTPPQSTTSTFMSEVVSYTEVNETTTTSAIRTSTAQTTSTVTSNVSWIVVGAVVGCIVVIIVIATVIGAVFITRRIRRKRSATGLLQTSTTRVTYPSNEIHSFNIPIDPKSKITDHGINFNDYLAVVPAYPEKIREFENAEQKKKDQMYVGFLDRIQAARRTEDKSDKI